MLFHVILFLNHVIDIEKNVIIKTKQNQGMELILFNDINYYTHKTVQSGQFFLSTRLIVWYLEGIMDSEMDSMTFNDSILVIYIRRPFI